MTTPSKRHIPGLELALNHLVLQEDIDKVKALLDLANQPVGWQAAAGDKVQVNRGFHPNGDKRRGEKGQIVTVDHENNVVLVLLDHTGAGQPTAWPLDTFADEFDLVEEEPGE